MSAAGHAFGCERVAACRDKQPVSRMSGSFDARRISLGHRSRRSRLSAKSPILIAGDMESAKIVGDLQRDELGRRHMEGDDALRILRVKTGDSGHAIAGQAAAKSSGQPGYPLHHSDRSRNRKNVGIIMEMAPALNRDSVMTGRDSTAVRFEVKATCC